MNFLKSLFDRRPAFDKLTELLDSRIDIYNGFNFNGIDQVEHLKRRHLKIKVGVYQSSRGDYGNGFEYMLYPLVEIWIDKDRNIVDIVEDFDRTGNTKPSTEKKFDAISKKGRQLVSEIKELGKLETEITVLNEIIDWFYEGPAVYFRLLESRILSQDHKLLMRHLDDSRKDAAKNKWKQKDIIHKLNCSK